LEKILSVITIITIVTALISIYYAFIWRKKPGALGKVLQSRMNIFMGIALLGLGTNQFFFEDLVLTRRIFAGIFIFIGLVNLIFGIRNHRYFKKMMQEEGK